MGSRQRQYEYKFSTARGHRRSRLWWVERSQGTGESSGSSDGHRPQEPPHLSAPPLSSGDRRAFAGRDRLSHSRNSGFASEHRSPDGGGGGVRFGSQGSTDGRDGNSV